MPDSLKNLFKVSLLVNTKDKNTNQCCFFRQCSEIHQICKFKKYIYIQRTKIKEDYLCLCTQVHSRMEQLGLIISLTNDKMTTLTKYPYILEVSN